MSEGLCKCGQPRRKSGSNCRDCHAQYMRDNPHQRKKYKDLTKAQKKKLNARSMVRTYIRRGKMKKMPCATCGSMENLEAHHHAGYDHPLEVTWYCKPCHIAEHERAGHDDKHLSEKASQKGGKKFDNEVLDQEVQQKRRDRRRGKAIFQGRERSTTRDRPGPGPGRD